jgi:hypothetical protein
MLHQHFLDFAFLDVRIERRLAGQEKPRECFFKFRVTAFVVNLFEQRACEFWNASHEIAHGVFKTFTVGFGVVEKPRQQLSELLAPGDIKGIGVFAVLPEDGFARVLENNVREWIARLDFALDFEFQFVLFVFGFPVPKRRVFILHGGVHFPILFVANRSFFLKAKAALHAQSP